MKLIRFGEAGKEKTGVIINKKKYDSSEFGEDYGEHFFETDGLTRLFDFIKDKSLPEIDEGTRRTVGDVYRLWRRVRAGGGRKGGYCWWRREYISRRCYGAVTITWCRGNRIDRLAR